jgi:hypothetical protein
MGVAVTRFAVEPLGVFEVAIASILSVSGFCSVDFSHPFLLHQDINCLVAVDFHSPFPFFSVQKTSSGPRIVVWCFVVESQPFEEVPREHIARVYFKGGRGNAALEKSAGSRGPRVQLLSSSPVRSQGSIDG